MNDEKCASRAPVHVVVRRGVNCVIWSIVLVASVLPQLCLGRSIYRLLIYLPQMIYRLNTWSEGKRALAGQIPEAAIGA